MYLVIYGKKKPKLLVEVLLLCVCVCVCVCVCSFSHMLLIPIFVL